MLFNQLAKIRESLDGKNIEFVLTELGVRLHRVIYDHLQQFTYNSSGVMAVICDVQVRTIFSLNYRLTIYSMDKLQLTGLNLGRVFNYRSRHASTQICTFTSSKQPKLQLKTRPKQVLGTLPLAFSLSVYSFQFCLVLCVLRLDLPYQCWYSQKLLRKLFGQALDIKGQDFLH